MGSKTVLVSRVLEVGEDGKELEYLRSLGFEVFERLGSLAPVWTPPTAAEVEARIEGEKPALAARRAGVSLEILWKWISGQESPTREQWDFLNQGPRRKPRAAIVTDDQRLEIALLVEQGHSIKSVAEKFGLSTSCVRRRCQI
jgi:transposase-like protein